MGDGDAEVELAKRFASAVGVRRDRRKALEALTRAMSSQFISGAGKDEAAKLMKQLRAEA